MGKEYQSPKQVIQSYLEERAKSDPLFGKLIELSK